MWRLLLIFPLVLFAVGEKEGISFDGWYAIDLQGNPVGGLNRGFANASSLELLLTVNKECWKFQCSGIYNSGRNLSAIVGNNFFFAQAFGGETAFLYQLYLLRRFCWGSIKVGRLSAGDEFLDSEIFGQYVAGTFNTQPITLFFNLPQFSAYPNATWGAVVQVNLRRHLSAKLAIYNANTRIFQNRFHGLNFTLDNTAGYLFVSEAKTNTWRVGGYYLTARDKFFELSAVQGNTGFYAMWEPCFDLGCGRSLQPWVTVIVAPRKEIVFPFALFGGVVAKGWIRGRPKDQTVFGVAYGRYQPSGQTYEMLLELNHWFWVHKQLAITPVVQYAINPQGLGTIPNALVLGLQIQATF